jgi:gamma-glutamyltranspeptidase/glutathione hydrolase
MRSAAFVLLLIVAGCAGAGEATMPPPGPTVSSVRGLVVSVSADASVVGRDVLARGGNAVDAAVATAFALAVTHPEAGNIGGGGFMLIHFPDAAARRPVVIDYRETAPGAVDADSFRAVADRTQIRLAGVPGTVRGLRMAH